MNNYKKVICVAVLATLPGAAFAGYPVSLDLILPGPVAQIGSTVTTPIVTGLTQVMNATVQSFDALRASLIGSATTIADMTEQRSLEAWKKQAKNDVQQHQQPAIDACGGQSQAAYAGSVLDISRALSSRMKASGATRAGNAPAASEQNLMTEVAHHRDYCNPDTDPQKCAGVSAKTNAKGELMADADTKASSLFTGAGVAGRAGNLTYDSEQVLAATKYIANAIDSTDSPRKLSPAEYGSSDGSGKKYEGLRTAYEARMSMSRDTLTDILAQRTPLPNSTAILSAIRDGSPVGGASYINDRNTRILGWSPNGDVSPLELMDIEVGRRIDNPKWYEAINTQADQTSLMREQTFMLALMLKLQYQQLSHGDVTASLNAIQSAENTKANMRPKIDAAEQAVLRGTSK